MPIVKMSKTSEKKKPRRRVNKMCKKSTKSSIENNNDLNVIRIAHNTHLNYQNTLKSYDNRQTTNVTDISDDSTDITTPIIQNNEQSNNQIDNEQSVGHTNETCIKKKQKIKRTCKRNIKKCPSISSDTSRSSVNSSLLMAKIDDFIKKKQDLETLKNNPPMLNQAENIINESVLQIKSKRTKLFPKNKTNSCKTSKSYNKKKCSISKPNEKSNRSKLCSKKAFKLTKSQKSNIESHQKKLCVKRKRSISKSSNTSNIQYPKKKICLNKFEGKRKSIKKCQTKTRSCKGLKSKSKCRSKIRRKSIYKQKQSKSRKHIKSSKKAASCSIKKKSNVKKCSKKRISSKPSKTSINSSTVVPSNNITPAITNTVENNIPDLNNQPAYISSETCHYTQVNPHSHQNTITPNMKLLTNFSDTQNNRSENSDQQPTNNYYQQPTDNLPTTPNNNLPSTATNILPTTPNNNLPSTPTNILPTKTTEVNTPNPWKTEKSDNQIDHNLFKAIKDCLLLIDSDSDECQTTSKLTSKKPDRIFNINYIPQGINKQKTIDSSNDNLQHKLLKNRSNCTSDKSTNGTINSTYNDDNLQHYLFRNMSQKTTEMQSNNTIPFVMQNNPNNNSQQEQEISPSPQSYDHHQKIKNVQYSKFQSQNSQNINFISQPLPNLYANSHQLSSNNIRNHIPLYKHVNIIQNSNSSQCQHNPTFQSFQDQPKTNPISLSSCIQNQQYKQPNARFYQCLSNPQSIVKSATSSNNKQSLSPQQFFTKDSQSPLNSLASFKQSVLNQQSITGETGNSSQSIPYQLSQYLQLSSKPPITLSQELCSTVSSNHHSNPQVLTSSVQNSLINHSNNFPSNSIQQNSPNQSLNGSQINPLVSPISPVPTSLRKCYRNSKKHKRKGSRRDRSRSPLKDSTGERKLNRDSVIIDDKFTCNKVTSRESDKNGSCGSSMINDHKSDSYKVRSRSSDKNGSYSGNRIKDRSRSPLEDSTGKRKLNRNSVINDDNFDCSRQSEGSCLSSGIKRQRKDDQSGHTTNTSECVSTTTTKKNSQTIIEKERTFSPYFPSEQKPPENINVTKNNIKAPVEIPLLQPNSSGGINSLKSEENLPTVSCDILKKSSNESIKGVEDCSLSQ